MGRICLHLKATLTKEGGEVGITKQEILDYYVLIDYAYNDSGRFESLSRMLDELLEERPEIVRCKDCKRRGTYNCPVYVGGDGMCSEPDDWFCADGKRK